MNPYSPPSLLARIVLVLWRLVVVTLWATAGYIVVGSILWPYWWYLFFWQRGFLQTQNYSAIVELLAHAPLPAAIVVVWLAMILLLLHVRHNSVARFVDRHGPFSLVAGLLLVLVIALVVNATQQRRWHLEQNLQVALRNLLKLMESMEGVTAEFTHVVPEPPVVFEFLDKTAVESLYGQIQPGFVEAARTEKRTEERGGKLEVGVASSRVSAETSGSRDQTSEFLRPPWTPERGTLELIQYCLDHGRASVIEDRPLMVARIELEHVAKLVALSRPCMIDLHSPACAQLSKMPPSAGQLEHDAEIEADQMLESQLDLVLLLAQLSPVGIRGTYREYGALISRPSKPLAVTILLPLSSELLGPSSRSGVGLRVFGYVTDRSAGSKPHLTVRAIAVF
jgi:hypothetical protein